MFLRLRDACKRLQRPDVSVPDNHLRRKAFAALFLQLAVFALGAPPSWAQTRAEVRAGHKGPVGEIAYAPDGKNFATASADHTIKIWSSAQNSEIRTLIGHTKDVFSIAYSPDGKYLVSTGEDSAARIWDANTGALLRTIPGNPKEYSSARFMPNGTTLVTLGIGVVRLWSMPDARLLRSFTFPEGPLAAYLRVSANGRLLAWGGRGQASVMDANTGAVLRTFATRTAFCHAVAFSPDSRILAIPIADEQVELHDAVSGALVRTLKPSDSGLMAAQMTRGTGQPLSYGGLAFSPDGRSLTAVGFNVRQWDVGSGTLLNERSSVSATQAVDYSPDGHTLALAQVDGVVGTQQAEYMLAAPSETSSPLDREMARITRWRQEHNAPDFRKADSSSQQPWNSTFAPDGKTLITVGGKDVYYWDLATGKIASKFPAPFPMPSFVRFSEDGRTLVLAGMEGSMTLDAATHKPLHHNQTSIITGKMSPDGHFLAGVWPSGFVSLIDLTRDVGMREVRRPDLKPIVSFAFSGDSRSFAAGGSDDSVVIWSLADYKTKTLKAGGNWVNALAYSRDGRLLAGSTNDGAIFLWDVGRGDRRQLRKPGGRVYGLTFNPDGQSLASVEDGGPIVFRALNDGHEIGRFNGGDGQINDLTFSPDGKRFSTRGANSTTIWDASGKPLASLYAFEDGSSVVMTPEGYYDASSETAEEKVSVRVSGTLYPISSYREKFYRPDLVRLALQGQSLAKFGRLEQIKVAPKVAFLAMPASTGNGAVGVKLKLTDLGGGIGQVRLFVNGSAVIEDTLGARDVPSGGKEIQRSYVVHLPSGKSELKAIAFNADNSMQSAPETTTITSETQQVAAPALYALVVGIQKFQNPRFDLKFTTSDAELFAKTLQQRAAGLYSKVTVKTLTSPEETTRDGLIAALKTARDAVGPNDLFVFYVASHGVSDDGEYFLITSNVGSPSTERLKLDALDKETLTGLLANIPSTKKLIVIDTCQAAALGNSLSAAILTRGMSDIAATKILSRAVGSTVLAATNSDQEAMEGYLSHGLFTFVVAEGLAGKADTDHDGYVTTLELAAYVDAEVPLLAAKVYQRQQYPTVAPIGLGFPLAKVN